MARIVERKGIQILLEPKTKGRSASLFTEDGCRVQCCPGEEWSVSERAWPVRDSGTYALVSVDDRGGTPDVRIIRVCGDRALCGFFRNGLNPSLGVIVASSCETGKCEPIGVFRLDTPPAAIAGLVDSKILGIGTGAFGECLVRVFTREGVRAISAGGEDPRLALWDVIRELSKRLTKRKSEVTV